jgi:hypothetical protein
LEIFAESAYDPQRVAVLLNDLFRTYQHPLGREFTNREVSRAIDSDGSIGLTAGFIHQLREGRRVAEASVHNSLLVLCVFFEVEPSYFHEAGVLQLVQSIAGDASLRRNLLFTARSQSIPADPSLFSRLYEWLSRR